MSGAMTVALIDYGSGNLHSAHKALVRAARERGVEADIHVTSDPDRVRRADRVVLPGVGAFADCRRGLDAVSGMVEALEERVRNGGAPFLGICVGMQLLAGRGLEKEEMPGLAWIEGEVRRMETRQKLPQIGWNTLQALREHPLLGGVQTGEDGLHAYFVHSFHLAAANEADVVATTEHGATVTAVVARDNVAGTQFHPEKSQRLGLALLGNFLLWSP